MHVVVCHRGIPCASREIFSGCIIYRESSKPVLAVTILPIHTQYTHTSNYIHIYIYMYTNSTYISITILNIICTTYIHTLWLYYVHYPFSIYLYIWALIQVIYVLRVSHVHHITNDDKHRESSIFHGVDCYRHRSIFLAHSK